MAATQRGVRGQISSGTTQLQRSEGIPPHDVKCPCEMCNLTAPRRQRTESRSDIYYIGVDKQPTSARETNSPAAFDELFKFHFVLSLSDEECLALIYTFVLASVYSITSTLEQQLRPSVNCRQKLKV
ncbi:hypothetical protein KUCAC02_018462 [Chaenocephalus aceratus]|uniref:Uncharacterized protein n=1 Tax=Chaenocephalus aceratus TaxID=36190 RepID=A0ACB9W9F1_CHAAC|nr:hypothetical protein KUCAC02_018462 [Chaenocephalus aceratus]